MHPDRIILVLFGVIAIYSVLFFGFAMIVAPLVVRVRKMEYEARIHQMEAKFQEELLKSKYEIQEDTLAALALDLHDNIGQLIYLAQLHVTMLDPVKESFKTHVLAVETSLDAASDGLHNVLRDLQINLLKEGGLRKSVAAIVSKLQASTAFKVAFVEEGPYLTIPPNKEVFMFRIFQEAINNIVRHAEAQRIDVHLIYVRNNVVLCIKDDGKGFQNDASQTKPPVNQIGRGLTNMYMRAALIGATITVESELRQGTYVKIDLPID